MEETWDPFLLWNWNFQKVHTCLFANCGGFSLPAVKWSRFRMLTASFPPTKTMRKPAESQKPLLLPLLPTLAPLLMSILFIWLARKYWLFIDFYWPLQFFLYFWYILFLDDHLSSIGIKRILPAKNVHSDHIRL